MLMKELIDRRAAQIAAAPWSSQNKSTYSYNSFMRMGVQLGEYSLGDEDMEYFCSKTQFTWLGMATFSRADWSGLMFLDLQGNAIGSKGVKYLTRINLENIESLSLIDCGIGSGGAVHISKSQWSKASFLYIQTNKLIGDDTKNLMKRKQFKPIAYKISGNIIPYHSMMNVLLSPTQITLSSLNRYNFIQEDKRKFQILCSQAGNIKTQI